MRFYYDSSKTKIFLIRLSPMIKNVYNAKRMNKIMNKTQNVFNSFIDNHSHRYLNRTYSCQDFAVRSIKCERCCIISCYYRI